MGGSGSTPPGVSDSAGDPATVLGADMAAAPRPRVALSRPPQQSFLFTVARSIVNLVIVDISCAMATRSLAVSVAKFMTASTMSWWKYP